MGGGAGGWNRRLGVVLAATRLFVAGAPGLRAAGARGRVAGFNADFNAGFTPPAESDEGAARGRGAAVFRAVAVVFILPVLAATLELLLLLGDVFALGGI